MSRILLLVAAIFLVSCRTEPTASARNEPREIPTGSVRSSAPILSYADVVDRVAPAVVTIRSSRRVRAAQQFPFFDEPFFRQFFGGGVPRQPRTEVQRALGSGVIVREDGHILTNHHVIDGAEDIRVDMSNK